MVDVVGQDVNVVKIVHNNEKERGIGYIIV